MLTGIHFLLTYACNYECDHCFLYCSPRSKGTFTIEQVRSVLDQSQRLGTIEWIFFEGGEPFLYYPLLLEAIRLSKARGFKVGVVTNAYPAQTVADARLWLAPLADLKLDFLSISDDDFHSLDPDDRAAKVALEVAEELALPVSSIHIDRPDIDYTAQDAQAKGDPIVRGGPKFRGRAIEKLGQDLPRRPWEQLATCPFEDLESLSRVHVDAYGNVQLCQGLSMGNLWETPLSDLVAGYDPQVHPVCGPLLRGGPAQLARETAIDPEPAYIDECHMCSMVRRSLLERFPKLLGPKQVYGTMGGS